MIIPWNGIRSKELGLVIVIIFGDGPSLKDW